MLVVRNYFHSCKNAFLLQKLVTKPTAHFRRWSRISNIINVGNAMLKRCSFANGHVFSVLLLTATKPFVISDIIQKYNVIKSCRIRCYVMNKKNISPRKILATITQVKKTFFLCPYANSNSNTFVTIFYMEFIWNTLWIKVFNSFNVLI